MFTIGLWGRGARPLLDAVEVEDVEAVLAAPDGSHDSDHLAAHHTLILLLAQLLDQTTWTTELIPCVIISMMITLFLHFSPSWLWAHQVLNTHTSPHSAAQPDSLENTELTQRRKHYNIHIISILLPSLHDQLTLTLITQYTLNSLESISPQNFPPPSDYIPPHITHSSSSSSRHPTTAFH